MNMFTKPFFHLSCGLVFILSTLIALPANARTQIAELKTACIDGDMQSCVQIAALFYTGDTVSKDLQQAALYNGKACYGGDSGACSTLAKFYQSGDGVAKEPLKVIQFHQKACDLGDITACSKIQKVHIVAPKTQICETGPACYMAGKSHQKQRDPKALSYFQHGCQAFSHGENCYTAARLHTRAKAPELAAQMYDYGCEIHHTQSCYKLGQAYRYGKGVGENHPRALQILAPLCETTNPHHAACWLVGTLYDQKIMQQDMGIEKDWSKAAHFYQTSCNTFQKTGNDTASFNCELAAILYMQGGYGLAVDKEKSIATYIQGCNPDIQKSHTCLQAGLHLLTGNAVAQNTETGILMIETGCEKDTPFACYHLGKIYEDGQHRPKQLQKSTELYARACDQTSASYGQELARPCVAAADIFATQGQSEKSKNYYGSVCNNDGSTCALVTAARFLHQCEEPDINKCKGFEFASLALLD